MSDEALEKWIEAELPPKMPLEFTERMVRAAWHAAVKHTLEHVASELSKDAKRLESHGERGLDRPVGYMRAMATDILKMKP